MLHAALRGLADAPVRVLATWNRRLPTRSLACARERPRRRLGLLRAHDAPVRRCRLPRRPRHARASALLGLRRGRLPRDRRHERERLARFLGRGRRAGATAVYLATAFAVGGGTGFDGAFDSGSGAGAGQLGRVARCWGRSSGAGGGTGYTWADAPWSTDHANVSRGHTRRVTNGGPNYHARLKNSSGGGTRTHNLDLNRILLCLIELGPQIVHSSYPGDRAETALHLRVAIRAQEDALAYLRTQTLDAMGAALRDPELLGMRIQMMELKCRHAPFITAQPATSAGLLNQKVLYLAATSYNRLHPAVRHLKYPRDPRTCAKSSPCRGHLRTVSERPAARASRAPSLLGPPQR